MLITGIIEIGYGEKCPHCDLINEKDTDILKHLMEKHPKEFNKIFMKEMAERTIHCQICGKVRESIQMMLCNMCSELQANEDELRRKDHEKAMRPRKATKVVKKLGDE